MSGVIEIFKYSCNEVKETVNDARSMMNEGLTKLKYELKSMKNWWFMRDYAEQIAANIYKDTGILFDDDDIDDVCDIVGKRYGDENHWTVRTKSYVKDDIEREFLKMSNVMIIKWINQNGSVSYSR